MMFLFDSYSQIVLINLKNFSPYWLSQFCSVTLFQILFCFQSFVEAVILYLMLVGFPQILLLQLKNECGSLRQTNSLP